MATNRTTRMLKNIDHYVLIEMREKIERGLATLDQIRLYEMLLSTPKDQRRKLCLKVFEAGRKRDLQ